MCDAAQAPASETELVGCLACFSNQFTAVGESGTFASNHVILDPHTADGVHVGRLHRDTGVPLVCIETALPAKFADVIREALGREPDRPSAYTDLEGRSQHFNVLPADAERVKAFIAAHAGAGA